jgi:hypothetical protein
MNTYKAKTIFITILLTLVIFYFCILIHTKLSDKNNVDKNVVISQQELIQFEEAKTTLHSFRELLLDIPDSIFNNIITESYYWEQIKQYYEKYEDNYEL